MYLERPEEYKKQVETQFYKGIREILKPALNELNESSNGRLPTFINLENYDFVSEGNDFLYPVQKGRWLGFAAWALQPGICSLGFAARDSQPGICSLGFTA